MDDYLYERLLNAAFNFLSYRPRSEKEIHDFLEKKQKRSKTFAPTIISLVSERLRELGYINDAKFVSWWIEQRSTFRPKGTALLRRELLNKGIERKIVDEIITSVHQPQDELQDARKLVTKKLPVWQKLPVLARRRKIYAYLGSRGFAPATVHRIIDEYAGKAYNREAEL
ncbi:RecX family transcriptional regulator [Patescibacteria group bacterium]|nr:RecX family transcriptional regulator [Patescibacteria group bacterium]